MLFRNDTAEMLLSLTEAQLLEVMGGVPQVEVPLAELETGKDIISFISDAKILASKGEARKMLQNGGISINKSKVTAQDFVVNRSSLLRDRYILVQRGKTNYYLVKAV